MTVPDGRYIDMTKGLSEGLSDLRVSTPEVLRAFNDLGHAAMKPGSLDRKTKELIALAIGVATRCDPCIGFHAQALAKLGADQREVDEMLGVAVYMGGGPSLMHAVHARAAFEEFLQLHEPRHPSQL
ncbi:MAG: carboxymuconolactone decarboxylase family protein [Paucibacter sp.]|nr:carboxymuconolactone decarboxylase family protein [Roseateles sp.]